ncbi:hypothetical protein HJG60_011932 [Phyllostomus discolor]|uniref:Uncharacterized protein n=1 Tax=Phyllostomus discolor TaxID=89673 RepID=A0A834DYH3_9CHIR|nr:hypothetical protein HJG60_011932 [Phyllostomus discolor]
MSIRTSLRSYKWVPGKVPPSPARMHSLCLSGPRHSPQWACTPHVPCSLPLWSPSPQYLGSPLPNTCLCRQKRDNKRPRHTAQGMVRSRGDWRNEALSTEGEVLAGYPGEGVGHCGQVRTPGQVWWAGGQWSNRPVMVIVVNGTPALLGQEPSPRQN